MGEHKWLGPVEEAEWPGGPKRVCTRPRMLAAVAVAAVLFLLAVVVIVVLAVQVGRGHPGVQEQCGNKTWLVQQHLTRLQDTLADTKGLLAASNRTAESLKESLQKKEEELEQEKARGQEREGEMQNLRQQLQASQEELQQLRNKLASSAGERASYCTWLVSLAGILMILTAA
ncbi:huntingtin-interacting protein 1-like [Erinaceus europaeus]|uniref:Huntingtin-interacting protein 1-like n=1 Tax=Erinaceus europaeus TaxID=9365 RepID=A0ABM3WPA8_ERIEU|nr:huntingtin-interacting protein 1-like [Erinaceus europaeus]